jgi:hypothetical protein
LTLATVTGPPFQVKNTWLPLKSWVALRVTKKARQIAVAARLRLGQLLKMEECRPAGEIEGEVRIGDVVARLAEKPNFLAKGLF